MELDLIKTLEEEHRIMRDLFDGIDKEGDLENKKNLIRKLQTVSISHLKKEDEELYPVLEKSKDEEIRRTGKIFSITMKDYAMNFIIDTEMILALTNKISPSIYADYRKVCDRIKDRISIEEVTIFPEYEKTIRENN